MLKPQREIGKVRCDSDRGEACSNRGLVETVTRPFKGYPSALVSCSSCLGFMSKKKKGLCLPLSLPFGEGG